MNAAIYQSVISRLNCTVADFTQRRNSSSITITATGSTYGALVIFHLLMHFLVNNWATMMSLVQKWLCEKMKFFESLIYLASMRH